MVVDRGSESDKLPMEKAFLGAADFKGTLLDPLRPWPRADPTRSPKRFGSDFGIPIPEEAERGGAADAHVLPKISPTMETGAFARLPDLAAPVITEGAAGVHEGRDGWCDQAGAVGLEAAAGVA